MATQPAVIELDADFPYQDYVMIGGQKSPGKATIRNAISPRDWDERKAYGLDGATLALMGAPLATFEVLFELWDPNDVPAWYAFAARWFDKSVVLTPGSKEPRALAIQHPILAAPPLRITSAIVLEATQLDQDEYDLWSCTVKFKQYRPAKVAKSAPVVSIPAASQPQPTAQDASDADIAAKQAQLASLAKAQGLL